MNLRWIIRDGERVLQQMDQSTLPLTYPPKANWIEVPIEQPKQEPAKPREFEINVGFTGSVYDPKLGHDKVISESSEKIKVVELPEGSIVIDENKFDRAWLVAFGCSSGRGYQDVKEFLGFKV